MAAQAFHFKCLTRASFAQGHTSGSVTLAVDLTSGHQTTLNMPPADARAMAAALEAAATFAENTLATGLGESAVST